MMLESICLTMLSATLCMAPDQNVSPAENPDSSSTVAASAESASPGESASSGKSTSKAPAADGSTSDVKADSNSADSNSADGIAPAGNSKATNEASSADPPKEVVAAEEFLLRYKFHKGQKFRYLTWQKMTLEATVGEARKIDISEYRQRRLFTVLSVEEDDSAHVAMQFENVWMQKQIDDLAAVEFNSRMKDEEIPPAFRQAARQLRGNAPKYWLSNIGLSMYPTLKTASKSESADDGEVIDLVEGIQLVAASDDGNKTQKKRSQPDPGSFLMTLPEEKVQVGDTWTETIEVPVRLQSEITIDVPILRTFRLDSVENGVANISFRCSVESRVRSVVVSSQLIQATPRGTITFDVDRGIILRREMRYDEAVFGALGEHSLLKSFGTNTEELLEGDSSENP